MHFLVHFQAQRPEQSVMQALESLSDSQVRPEFFYMLLIVLYHMVYENRYFDGMPSFVENIEPFCHQRLF